MKIMGAFRYYASEPEHAVSTSRRKQLRLYHNDQLMGKSLVVYCASHTEHMNIQCGENGVHEFKKYAASWFEKLTKTNNLTP